MHTLIDTHVHTRTHARRRRTAPLADSRNGSSRSAHRRRSNPDTSACAWLPERRPPIDADRPRHPEPNTHTAMKTTLALCAAAAALMPSAAVVAFQCQPAPGVVSTRSSRATTTRMTAAPANEEGGAVSRGGFLSTLCVGPCVWLGRTGFGSTAYISTSQPLPPHLTPTHPKTKHRERRAGPGRRAPGHHRGHRQQQPAGAGGACVGGAGPVADPADLRGEAAAVRGHHREEGTWQRCGVVGLWWKKGKGRSGESVESRRWHRSGD